MAIAVKADAKFSKLAITASGLGDANATSYKVEVHDNNWPAGHALKHEQKKLIQQFGTSWALYEKRKSTRKITQSVNLLSELNKAVHKKKVARPPGAQHAAKKNEEKKVTISPPNASASSDEDNQIIPMPRHFVDAHKKSETVTNLQKNKKRKLTKGDNIVRFINEDGKFRSARSWKNLAVTRLKNVSDVERIYGSVNSSWHGKLKNLACMRKGQEVNKARIGFKRRNKECSTDLFGPIT